MKLRSDFVSNSSSCSFIIHVKDEDDKRQLARHEDVLKKYAREVSNDFNRLPYGSDIYFESVDKINVGDFIRIYLCEDNDGWDDFRDFTSELIDIHEKVNEGGGKIEAYSDYDAHYSIGENYKEDKE